VLLDSLAERPAPHRRGSPRRAARNDHDVARDATIADTLFPPRGRQDPLRLRPSLVRNAAILKDAVIFYADVNCKIVELLSKFLKGRSSLRLDLEASRGNLAS
jgi:hypothetical protein